MPGYFLRYSSALSLRAQEELPNSGFRPGQLGALHAVLAHASIYGEPATICLPTGYGKTSLMMALPLQLKANRVLIVEPSNALRKQVGSHFSTLSTLRKIGVIDAGTPDPRVLRHEGRPASEEEWRVLADFDVVISTPSSSSPSLAPGSPSDLFDLVIFDEAHHAPADTWAAYLAHYAKARFVFLTATPFRRDGKPIPGKLVYRYPVMRAVSEGAFVPVAFRAAAVENELDDAHVDSRIAVEAVQQLREDAGAGHDHRLFIRAASISAARALVPVYKALGVNVEAIDSKISKRHQDDCERRLVNGELDGIVCVDMFGEGYDFPKLKIAALHAPHQSLVPTIQFIGRFARVDPQTGGAVLIAPEFRIRKEAGVLLREGVDLAHLIDEAASGELAGDAEEQELLEKLPVRKAAESDYDGVSPLSLQLYAHARIFRCNQPPDFNRFDNSLGRDLRVVKQWASEDGLISLLLTADENPPSWATSEALVNMRHDVFLLIYREASRLCYVGSTRRTEKLYLGMMDQVLPDNYRTLSYEETSRARAGLEAVRFFNVGLKNTTFNSQSETYRTLTGPQAERAVTAGDSRAYVQGHFFGSGFNGEEKETIGASSSSRIWSNQRLTVLEFLKWIERMDARLSGTARFAETHLDIVQASKTLHRLPETIFAAAWPRTGFKANHRIRYRGAADHTFCFRRLTEWEICAFDCRPDAAELRFSLTSEEATVPMLFTLGGGKMVVCLDEDAVLEIESAADDWMPLADWLAEHPPRFYATDKSSFEGLNSMAPPLLQAATLAPGDAESISWENCAIEVEFLPNNNLPQTQRRRAELRGLATVQEHLQQHLLGIPGLIALFYDHRTGEAADFVAATQTAEGAVEIALYHCKGAGGAPSGGRVDDVYEVAGQLVKSVFYCDVSTLLSHMEGRMHARHAAPSSFLHGNFDALKAAIQGVPATKLSFSVVGVQPGIRRAAIGAHLADLMAFGINYARQGGATRAYWLVSE